MNIVILIVLIVSIGTYIYINVTYKKYSKKDIAKLMSGFEVSREILDEHDLNNIYITESREELYSKYDYKRKVVKLIRGVFSDTSLTSCAIAAMNAAYAVQDKNNNKLFKFKKNLEQFISLLLYTGYLFIIIGALFGHINTIWIGFGIELLILVFHIATYYVEKEARDIALVELLNNKIINKREIKRIRKLLDVTSYIGIASIVFPIAELLKRIYEFGRSD